MRRTAEGKMDDMKTSPIGAVAQYARSFYGLLANRRKYERTPMSGAVRVTCSAYGVETVHACSCVDISPRGMAIDCPDPIATDTIIGLYAEEYGRRLAARVCYCRARGTAYRIGLEFTTGDGAGSLSHLGVASSRS